MKLGEFRNTERELYNFQVRISVAGFVVMGAFALLFLRFVYLQVIQHDYYQTKAEDNRISIVPIAPNRGNILDRNGVVLARNYSAYTLEIAPGKIANLEETINQLATIVVIWPSDRSRFKRLLIEAKGAETLPIRIRLSDEEVARFAVSSWPMAANPTMRGGTAFTLNGFSPTPTAALVAEKISVDPPSPIARIRTDR
jgi:penicillin-binding protein 2